MNYSLIKSQFLLLTLVLMLPAAVSAARVTDLYTVETEVEGRAPAQRQAGMQAALAEVLLRMVGSQALLQEPAIRQLTDRAQTYVDQFRYREQAAEEPDAPGRLLLWVKFDGVALTRALRERGLPVWGQERPDMLVWLAIDDGGRRYLMSEQSDQPAAEVLRRAAQRRGLPVLLPLMDLDDRRQVRFADIWGGFLGAVQQASQRYRPQVVLVGRLHRDRSGGWQARWVLMQDDAGLQNWELRSGTLEEAIDNGIGESAGLLALRYAVQSGAPAGNTRRLRVTGVDSLAAYARVRRYLGSLSPVDRVEVARVQGDEIEFSVRLNGEERNLLQVIAIGRVLEPVAGGAPWRYRLRQ